VRVVVTGSSGHLGATVVPALRDEGVEAIGMDSHPGPQTAVVADIREAGVESVVYSSTTSVYGHALEPRDTAVWVDEELEPRPRDIYDVTKLAAERLCALFAAETEIPTTSLRVSRFSFDTAPGLAVPYCLHRAVNVGDAPRAHLLALGRRRRRPPRRQRLGRLAVKDLLAQGRR
jgi:nucleoside-diphosphate-sugar epimerase